MGKMSEDRHVYYTVLNVMHNINVHKWWGFVKKQTRLTWAKGMIGACPVFDNLADAENYAKEQGSMILECHSERDGKEWVKR